MNLSIPSGCSQDQRKNCCGMTKISKQSSQDRWQQRVQNESPPSVLDGNDASNLSREADEHGVSEVEVLLGSVAPSSQGPMGTEVGRSNGDCWAPWKAVFGAIGVASKLIAGAAAKATVEQGSTECRSVGSVTGTVEVPESTCPACISKTAPRTVMVSKFSHKRMNDRVTH